MYDEQAQPECVLENAPGYLELGEILGWSYLLSIVRLELTLHDFSERDSNNRLEIERAVPEVFGLFLPLALWERRKWEFLHLLEMILLHQ
jgi:hypothetical protein